MRADRVRPRTYDIQGHYFTSNTRKDQIVKQKGNELPTLIPPRFKDSNIGSYVTIVHLCSEFPHKVPKGQSPKPIKL